MALARSILAAVLAAIAASGPGPLAVLVAPAVILSPAPAIVASAVVAALTGSWLAPLAALLVAAAMGGVAGLLMVSLAIVMAFSLTYASLALPGDWRGPAALLTASAVAATASAARGSLDLRRIFLPPRAGPVSLRWAAAALLAAYASYLSLAAWGPPGLAGSGALILASAVLGPMGVVYVSLLVIALAL